MKITELRVMRGPNYWLVKHPKIFVIELALEDFNDKLTHDLPQFLSRIHKVLPSLLHHCSTGAEGGFFKAIEQGITFGHMVQHVALELQIMAGMESGYCRCYPTHEEGHMMVVFLYQEERAVKYAAYAAVQITVALGRGYKYKLSKGINRLHDIREDEYFGLSTYSIVSEAVNRGISYNRLNRHSLIQLGYGKYQKRIQATMTCRTACLAIEIAGDKNATKDLLRDAGILVPKGTTDYTQEELKCTIDCLGYPLVIKP